MNLHKYQGAGNDFLIIDDRSLTVRETFGTDTVSADKIAWLCDRRYGIGADGLMLLRNSDKADFQMVYYNSDGSGGMMCGNGGRCIVAFAADLGIIGTTCRFIAPDGPHTAEIVSVRTLTSGANTLTDGLASQSIPGTNAALTPITVRTISLGMKDVLQITPHGDVAAPAPSYTSDPQALNGYFLDTGTRHFVKFVSNLADYDIDGRGRTIRHNSLFAPEGTNVNFIEPIDGILHIRTFEKGVEAETSACGTGITASAIALYHHIQTCPTAPRAYRDAIGRYADGRVHIDVQALHDPLSVDFMPVPGGARNVVLTGPAVRVAGITV